MNIKNIHENWCTEYTTSYDEFMEETAEVWRDRLVSRGLLIIKGFGPNLTDKQFHNISSKFGTLWTVEDYRAGSGKFDVTLNKETLGTPTSYFKTTNNHWKDTEMFYHSDMAHIGEKSFPARALYMVRTANDDSGQTEWLNLEEAYDQFTDEEKEYYSDVNIFQHYMYEPGTRITEYPFLKTNPYSGRVSPRMNCYGKGKTWIHHVTKGGEEVIQFREFMEKIFRLCESKSNTLYKHKWDNGDMLIYDNWNSVHRRDLVTFQPGEPDRLLKRLSFNISNGN
jgi:alpha-ketoglutarate-dependent taurine dioxygenase